MTFSEAVNELEAGLSVPGTQIVRQIDPDGPGMRWCVAVGEMHSPKCFYTGKTIEEAVRKAMAGQAGGDTPTTVGEVFRRFRAGDGNAMITAPMDV